MDKQCQRCQEYFECKADDVQNCNCRRLKLSKETLEYLKSRYYDCLCNGCLIDLNILNLKTKEFPFPNKSGEMIEGVHYYLEGPYQVMTEFYHLSRGYCCKSRCRHCAYNRFG